MRSTRIGWLLVAAVFLAIAFGETLAGAFAQRAGTPQAPTTAGESLASHSVELADGRQQFTLIDNRTRAIAVYQVDARSGAISLKSVRNVHWDLQMDEFNIGGNPSPKEIRSLLEQR